MNKHICTLSVSLSGGPDSEVSHPNCISPANLYFRPGLLKVSDLKNLTTTNQGEAMIAVSSAEDAPETQRLLWPDGSVRFTQTDVWLREQHSHGKRISVVLSDRQVAPIESSAIAEDADDDFLSRDISPLIAKRMMLPKPELAIGWGEEKFPILSSISKFNETLFTQDWIEKCELPGGRWLELFLRFREGFDVVEFWGQAGWNDRADPEPSKDLPKVWISTRGLWLNMDFEKTKVARFVPGDDRVILSEAGRWNDGQTVTFHGTVGAGFSKALPATIWQVDAAAHGAMGWLHSASPSLAAHQSAEDWAVSEMSKLDSNDPWQAGFWVPTEPGQTGDHAGFGLSGPASAIYYGSPSAINLMRFACYQEGCRPIWRRMFRKVMTDADYKNHGVLMWDERPHPAGNLLGKNGPPNIYTSGMHSKKGQIWWGMDRQHGEDVAWVTYLTLVNDPLVRRMAMDRAETWMAALRIDTGNTSIDGTDTGRGARLLGMLCRYLNIIPDWKIRERILQRVELYARSIYLEGPSPVVATTASVVPQQVYDPSNQAGGLPVPHWRPWEDAIVAYVLSLGYGATGSPMALASAQAIATNIVLHGFERMADGKHRLYVALAYNSGTPLNEEQLKDQNLAKNSEGTGYHLWAHPALVVAWNSSIMLGEQNEEARPKMKVVMDLAGPLLSEIYQSTKSVFTTPWASYEEAGENSEWVSLTPLPAPSWYTQSFN